MAIAFILDMPGVTADQLDKAAELLGVGPGSVPDGQISHVESVTAGGATIIDVWESEEAFGRFMARLGPILHDVGLPEFPPPPLLQVHRVFVAAVGAAAP